MQIDVPADLANYTVQDIQLELIRRSGGRKLYEFLLEFRHLWIAAFMDRLFPHSHRATSLIQLPALYQLRDLPQNYWNVDTLYVLTDGESNQKALIDRGLERNLWDESMLKPYDAEHSYHAIRLGGFHVEHLRVFSVWWD